VNTEKDIQKEELPAKKTLLRIRIKDEDEKTDEKPEDIIQDQQLQSEPFTDINLQKTWKNCADE